MKHTRSITALLLTCALLVLSPGAASAKVTETDDRGAGGESTVTQWRLDVNEATGQIQRVPDWYGAPDAGLTATEPRERTSGVAGSGAGSGYDHWSVPAAEAERDAAFLRHWGLDPQEFGTAAGGAGDTDVGAARNDVGPAAPAEPETTPVVTGVDVDQVIGWSAAGVALLAALVAGGIFLRRRHGHLVSHA